MDKSKRSVVKHRTNQNHSGSNQGQKRHTKKQGGFRSVGANLPDGAYLGKAKKVKANLIQNAKIKARFFKNERRDRGKGEEEGDRERDGSEAHNSNALGRFARENGNDNEEPVSSGGRTRQRRPKERVPVANDSRSRSDDVRRDRAGPPPPSSPPRRSERAPPRYSSRAEAQEARLKRQEKWTTTSRSKHGAQRGQPDLGARMDVLLDKIQRS